MLETLPLFPILLPSVSFEERRSLPAESGIYFALSANGEVLYVGATENLQKRWKYHGHRTRLEEMSCGSIAYYCCPVDHLAVTERAMISQFKPPLNGSFASLYTKKRSVKHTTPWPSSWRLSAEARRLLQELANRFSISQTAVLELAIRQMAKEHTKEPR